MILLQHYYHLKQLINDRKDNLMNNRNTTTQNAKRSSVGDLVLTAMFTALLCIMAQISIPMQPIPLTLSLFALFLIGALLKPRYAFLSALVYLLLGAFGAPVFAGFRGGLMQLTGPTGGYLLAYPLMTLITALSLKLGRKYRLPALAFGMTFSLLLCYTIGTLWFTFISGKSLYVALTLCVFPFIPLDIVKIILTISVSTIIQNTALRQRQSL